MHVLANCESTVWCPRPRQVREAITTVARARKSASRGRRATRAGVLVAIKQSVFRTSEFNLIYVLDCECNSDEYVLSSRASLRGGTSVNCS